MNSGKPFIFTKICVIVIITIILIFMWNFLGKKANDFFISHVWINENSKTNLWTNANTKIEIIETNLIGPEGKYMSRVASLHA